MEGDERFFFDRGVVVFWGMDGETRVRCEISREALDDHFGGDGKDKLEVFKANRRAIEDIARRKYLAGETEPDGSVLIRTLELEVLRKEQCPSTRVPVLSGGDDDQEDVERKGCRFSHFMVSECAKAQSFALRQPTWEVRCASQILVPS